MVVIVPWTPVIMITRVSEVRFPLLDDVLVRRSPGENPRIWREDFVSDLTDVLPVHTEIYSSKF